MDISDDKRIITMRDEAPFRAVLKMGLPLVMGLTVMGLYNLVDTFFIGLTKDDYQLAAVNLAYPVMMISVAVSNMIGTGAASLIARSLGSGDIKKARHTLTAGMELCLIASILLTVIGTVFLSPLTRILGAKENTFDYTLSYTRIILLGSVFTMGSYCLGQLLRSEGSAKQAMLGMLTGTVVNIILDPVFIFLLGLGIRGAAIATVIGNAAGTAIPVFLYAGGKSLLKPSRELLIPTKEIIGEVFRVGVPAMLETLLTSAAFIVNNNLAVAYGELSVAAMGISQKIISIGANIYQGFSAGNQPLMGYNYGAKSYSRMLKLLKAGVAAVTGIELCVLALYGIFAPTLIGIFTDSAEVIRTGSQVLRANMFCLIFVGSVSMSRSTFQAMGMPMRAFIITVLRQLVLYIPLLLVLNRSFGFGGIIWAQPITECVMMLISLLLLSTCIKKLKKSSVN